MQGVGWNAGIRSRRQDGSLGEVSVIVAIGWMLSSASRYPPVDIDVLIISNVSHCEQEEEKPNPGQETNTIVSCHFAQQSFQTNL